MIAPVLNEALALEELFGENDVRQAIAKANRPIVFLAEPGNVLLLQALLQKRELTGRATAVAYDDRSADQAHDRIVVAPANEEAILQAIVEQNLPPALGFYRDFYPKAVCFNWGKPEPSARAKRGYAIVSTPRSGSTLLAELMWNNDVGRPKEHLRTPAATALHVPAAQKRFARFLDQVIMSASYNDLFGTKIISHFAEAIVESVGVPAVLNSLDGFADFRLVLLLRENKVEQALSGYAAKQSSTFHLRDRAALEKHQERPIEYDFKLIEERYNWAMEAERRLLRAVNWLVKRPGHRMPMTVCIYEQLETDMAGEVGKILKFLSAEVARPNLDVRIQKLAGAQTRQLAERFAAEYRQVHGREPETAYREHELIFS